MEIILLPWEKGRVTGTFYRKNIDGGNVVAKIHAFKSGKNVNTIYSINGINKFKYFDDIKSAQDETDKELIQLGYRLIFPNYAFMI